MSGDPPNPSGTSSSEFSSRAPAAGGVMPCEEDSPPVEPCYLYKMVIREEWPDAKEPPPTEPVDLAAIDQEIEEKQQRLARIRLAIDQTLLSDEEDWEVRISRLKARRDWLQSSILDLLTQRSSAASPKVKPPATGVREFTIVRELDQALQAQKRQAKGELDEKRAELKQKIKEGYEVHRSHEDAKRELQAFEKDLEELRAEKDKKRLALEAARRHRDEAAAAWKFYNEEKQHSDNWWKTRKRKMRKAVKKDPKSVSKKADAAYEKAREEFEAAKRAHDAKAEGLGELQRDVKTKREATYTNIEQVRGVVAEVEAMESSYLELRNTLSPREGPIQMVGGAGGKWWTPWSLDQVSAEVSFKDGRTVTEKSSDDDPTPTVTVKLDTDTKPSAPEDGHYQSYCSRHPILWVQEPNEEFASDDITDETGRGNGLKFKVWQFRQFEKGAEKVEWAKAGLGFSLALVKSALRFLQWATSGRPAKRRYRVQARACGQSDVEIDTPVDPRTSSLTQSIEVLPADSWEIVIKTKPVAGFGYEYAQTAQVADAPQSETGQLQVESSGDKMEVSVSETFSSSNLWGTQSTSTTRSEIWGYDPGAPGSPDAGKHVTVVDTVTRDGSDLSRTMTADGTFHGQEYHGTMQESATLDASGNKTDVERTVTERGLIEEAHGGSGTTRGSGAVDVTRSGKLSRVPSIPGSMFPMCPVDISFKRNGVEDEVTQNIKNCVGTIIFLVRKTAFLASRAANIVPSWGWKFGCKVSFMAGTLSYYNQFREHVDLQVYMYRKGMLDIQVVKADIFLFGGFWVEFVVGSIEIGAEITIFGKIGIQGVIENTHPDADATVNLGFGPTGGVGCGAELRAVIGSADWCQAAAGVSTSITFKGMCWLKHTTGPHFQYDLRFDGVDVSVTGNLLLVGSYERVWHVVDAQSLKAGRYPDAFDDQDLAEQSAQMDKAARRDAEKARKLEEKRGRRRRLRQRRRERAGRRSAADDPWEVEL